MRRGVGGTWTIVDRYLKSMCFCVFSPRVSAIPNKEFKKEREWEDGTFWSSQATGEKKGRLKRMGVLSAGLS